MWWMILKAATAYLSGVGVFVLTWSMKRALAENGMSARGLYLHLIGGMTSACAVAAGVWWVME